MLPQVILVMGVAGSGKSTVGAALAKQLGWRFLEGDEFHPPENIAKIASGQPLTDQDRDPWLDAIHAAIATHLQLGGPCVLACSALKERYREILANGLSVFIVHLVISLDLARNRIESRMGHFFPTGLIESQFQALEKPSHALEIEATLAVEQAVRSIEAALRQPYGTS